VLLWALKPAEEGIAEGIIARVWNQSSDARSFSLALATGIAGARRTTHIRAYAAFDATANLQVERFDGGHRWHGVAATRLLQAVLHSS
jgi:hypothetical protein